MIVWLMAWCDFDGAQRGRRVTEGPWMTAPEACLRVSCPPRPCSGLTGRGRAPAENAVAAEAWNRRDETGTAADGVSNDAIG